MSTPTPTPKPLSETLGTARDFVIPRDGDRDLGFRGWRLSQVKDCQETSEYEAGRRAPLSRCTEIEVYITEDEQELADFAKIITHVHRWKERDGKRKNELHRVAVHSQGGLGAGHAAQAAIAWFKADNDGDLGSISKRAWMEACLRCPPLKQEAVERV